MRKPSVGRMVFLFLVVGLVCLGPAPAAMAQYYWDWGWYDPYYYYDYGYDYYYEPGYVVTAPRSYVVPWGLGGCDIEVDD